jgi:riboflavin kinase/FMN adenylyltransferase
MITVSWNDLTAGCGVFGEAGGIFPGSENRKAPKGAATEVSPRKTAITIGVFDGIHRGHQAIIAKITAKAPDMIPTVITFRENPKRIANPARFTGLEAREVDILSLEQKLALFEKLEVELCVVIDFSSGFCKLEGQVFFDLVRRFLHPAYAVIGSNFHCGYRRDTGAEEFRRLGEKNGVEVEIAPPVLEDGFPVSSSRIRELIGAGNRAGAALLLGRPADQL